MIPMLWPVYAYGSGERENLAVFFDYSAAVSFVNASNRNLYIAEPKYDRRVFRCRRDEMTPVNRTIEAMLAEQQKRHAWLLAAGKQLRRERGNSVENK